MDNKQLAAAIVKKVGGPENVTTCVHCVTRLRFTVIDESLVDKPGIEELEGVLGTARTGGQFQVIIGPGVDALFTEVDGLVGGRAPAAGATPAPRKRSLMAIVDALTAIIAPLIPALCAAGMLKVVLLLLTTVGWAQGTEGAYLTFSFIADVTFYFLPMLVAMSSAKRFNVDQGLAVCLGGALLYPTFVDMVSKGDPLHFFGVNVPMYTYSSTIFPALLGVLLLSYVHRFWDRVIRWDTVKLLLVPALSLGVAVPITLLLVAPLGNWGAQILGVAFTWLLATVGPLAGVVIGFFMPLMTLTGLHQSLAPIELFELSSTGGSRILPIEFFHNLAIAGAALGTAFATRDRKFKALSYQTGVTASVGVSEPALYTVMVKDRFAMLSAMIACGVGGGLGVMFGLRMSAYVWPNIFSIPTFLATDDPMATFYLLLIAILATFGVGAVMPSVFKMLGLAHQSVGVGSPVSGVVVPLAQVKDEVFSKGIVGEGMAVLPDSGRVHAPCDGVVVAVMNHAVGLRTKNGSEILVHVGIDTVGLESGMRAVVAKDQKVKRGQLLLEFDKDELERQGYDLTCVVVRTNGDVKLAEVAGGVAVGSDLFAV